HRNGGGAHAAPRGGGAHPVAEICEPVHRVDLIDPAAAEQAATVTDDHELERLPLPGQLDLEHHPLPRFVERVARVAPGHPGIDLGDGLEGGGVDGLDILLLIEPDGARAHGRHLLWPPGGLCRAYPVGSSLNTAPSTGGALSASATGHGLAYSMQSGPSSRCGSISTAMRMDEPGQR